MDHYVQFLSHLPVFASLTNSEIADIVRLFKPMSVAPGTLLCREGEPGTGIFVIEKGSVEIMKATVQGDTQVVAILPAPTVVGEMALIDGAHRSASARAVDAVTAYRIDCAEFNALRRAWNPSAYKVIYNLTRMLCDRLRDTNDKIEAFFADPHASLAAMQARQNDLLKQRGLAPQGSPK